MRYRPVISRFRHALPELHASIVMPLCRGIQNTLVFGAGEINVYPLTGDAT